MFYSGKKRSSNKKEQGFRNKKRISTAENSQHIFCPEANNELDGSIRKANL
ncbi:hypothetical protein WH47_06851 [Habropoda laboriosa]|uniref:Uncharacterized protein n=1 Tax=Habropoda laboriosa TaxID=597456 RepID=A0A0L7RJ90_9HYME|nr:hypothetical protein WH47_06851 [Habropoda laboriosa]